MADIGLGPTSLAITLISDVTKVLQYFLICLRDSKHFGEDVRMISTQINTETARLEAFQEFLKEKTFEDNTRFELLPRPHQAAIVGMVQELEILFGTYRTRLAKYGISELQGDTRIDHLPALDATPLDDTDELVRRGTMASIAAQQSAPGKEKVSWALFKKKNIFNIVRKLEDWNNKLQSFLLCGLCFLDDAKLLAMKDQSTLYVPQS